MIPGDLNIGKRQAVNGVWTQLQWEGLTSVKIDEMLRYVPIPFTFIRNEKYRRTT